MQKLKRIAQRIHLAWRNMWLQIGCELIRYGAVYKPGMKIKHPENMPSANIKTGVPTYYRKGAVYYIKNMYFNFVQNRIVYDLSTKRIKPEDVE